MRLSSDFSALTRLSAASVRAAIGVAILISCSPAVTTQRSAPAPTPTSNATAAGVSTEIFIAATTDVHGRLRGWDYQADRPDSARGLARAATVVDSLRRQHPDRVVLVDAGDLFQGNPLTFVASKVDPQPLHPVIAAMNVLRYDAAVIGNHEFNYGVNTWETAMRQARFPFLAGNVRSRDGSARYPGVQSIERAGVRIAIVGATTPGSMVWDRANLAAEGITIRDIVPYVRETVAAVRATHDIVVVVMHSGLGGPSSYDEATSGVGPENVSGVVAAEVPGVDLVVLGHSHREVVDSLVGNTLIVQPRNWAGSVAIARFALTRENGRWRVDTRKGSSVRLNNVPESQAVIAATLGAHERTLAWVKAPLGQTMVAWRSDSARVRDVPIIDFMLDVMRRTAGADIAATAAFSLDAAFEPGAITMAQLARLYPYDNTLRAIRISGAQLRAYLEHSARYYRSLGADGRAQAGGLVDPEVPGYNFEIVSGVEYSIDLTRPLGQRVTSLKRNGRDVAPSDSLTMALNNYRAEGGGGFSMLAGARTVYDEGRDIRDLLVEEIRRVGTIRPAHYAQQNWSLVPSAAVSEAMSALNRTRVSEARGTSATGASTTAASSNAAAGRGLATAAPRVAAGTKVLRVVSTNDLHGTHSPRPDAQGVQRGGAIPLAAAIAKARRECSVNCELLLLDGGDMFTGTPGSDWQYGRPMVEFMNTVGYTAAALGNHEFDYGRDTMYTRFRAMKFAVLGANVRGRDGQRPSWVRADTIVERAGVKVGIVGAAGTHTSGSTKAIHVNDLSFLDPAPIVSEHVRSLRARGAQVVVAVIHDGGRCERNDPDNCSGGVFEFVQALTDKPDLVVAGHSHTIFDARVNGVPVVQASSSGRAISVTDLPLDGADRVPRTAVRDVFGDSVSGADPAVARVIERSLATVGPRLRTVVATNAVELRREGTEYGLGKLIADATRLVGRGDVGMWNNGGIRATLAAGPVTMGALHEVVPFANQLVRARVRGRDLITLLNNSTYTRGPDLHLSGIVLTWNAARREGDLVEKVTLPDGRAIDLNAIYTVVMNDYQFGDPASIKGVPFISGEVLTVRDIDALAQHLRSLPQPVRAPADARTVKAGTP
jgi:2',3'-cyclic-nucleotide 2'-phosphodiesterase (5'-nucleotidase family)